MTYEAEDRADLVDQLSKLLSVTQDMGRKLANESHGRSYDRVREFNEILHLAREQLTAIEVAAGDGGRALVVQRTGFGKSAIYFIATALRREAGHGYHRGRRLAQDPGLGGLSRLRAR